MISLILKLDGSEKRFCFKKRSIVLGPKNAPDVDIPLPIESSTLPYAKIDEHNGRYRIINLANDPNLRFDSLPFGRRTLMPGSKLSIQNALLVVDSIDDFVEERIDGKEVEGSSESELVTLMREVESLEVHTSSPEGAEKSNRVRNGQKGRFIMTLSAACLLLASIFFGTFYFSSSVKTEEEELRAARGVADAAMALLHAKLHKIKPPNSNWADPNFLHRILTQVIPKTSNSCCAIDAQGNFKEFPYILRVYTNEDASRFVLVAQPQPNFISWASPKDSIVIESTSMELRKLEDIQPLNRIIFNTNSLNNSTSQRIATLVKEGSLIPLYKLDYSDPVAQYTPPSELQMVVPGAKNFVYNAPRYHKLTEPVLSQALSGKITQELLQELKELMNIPRLVFYTTEGVKSAVKAYKNLSDFITSQQLLVGYFTYHPKTHLPTKTELLVMNQPLQTAAKKVERAQKPNQSIKIQSELYQAMTWLANQRKQALRPIAEQISELLYENNGIPQIGFKEQLVTLLKDYERVDFNEQRRISQTLRKLYKKKVVSEQKLTSKQFMAYIKATGLTPYVQKQSRSKRKYNPLIQARGKVQSGFNEQTALETSVLE